MARNQTANPKFHERYLCLLVALEERAFAAEADSDEFESRTIEPLGGAYGIQFRSADLERVEAESDPYSRRQRPRVDVARHGARRRRKRVGAQTRGARIVTYPHAPKVPARQRAQNCPFA